MPQPAYQTFGEWLHTPLDISLFSVATLDADLADTPHFYSMPKGGLITGFIPQIGYANITPTAERTRNAIAHILSARDEGEPVKTQFYSWAAIISYAGNELDFENIHTNLQNGTKHALHELRRRTVQGINTALKNAPVAADDSLLLWMDAVLERTKEPEDQETLRHMLTRLRTGDTSLTITEEVKQQTAALLRPQYTDHCLIHAPDGSMLHAMANMDKPYTDLYAEVEKRAEALEKWQASLPYKEPKATIRPEKTRWADRPSSPTQLGLG